MRYVTIITLILLTKTASAQHYVPMTSTFKTPYGNFKTTTWSYRPMYYGGTAVARVYDTELTIVLKNDSTFTTKVTFNAADSVNNLVKEGRKKKDKDVVYKPADTKKIYKLVNGKILTGIPTDTCWMFKTKSGKINVYSPVPRTETDYYFAIQKGDNEPILPLTKDNLLLMVGDDQKLRKLVERKKFVRAIWLYNQPSM